SGDEVLIWIDKGAVDVIHPSIRYGKAIREKQQYHVAERRRAAVGKSNLHRPTDLRRAPRQRARDLVGRQLRGLDAFGTHSPPPQHHRERHGDAPKSATHAASLSEIRRARQRARSTVS